MRTEKLSEVFSKLNNSVMKFGTERTERLLRLVGYVEGSLKVVHIAGSNGKGSTAEYISSALVAAGRRTGLFTSPEVYTYADMFRIDGQPVSASVLEKTLAEVQKLAEGLGATPFEIETATAFKLFCDFGCEYAVIECGLGGLYDATNAVKVKSLAVIASTSLEHTAYLGGTIAEICKHKAGIITGCPAIVSALQPREAEEYYRSLGVKFADLPIKVLKTGADGQTFSYGGEIYEIRTAGFAQPYNAAAAIEAARLLGVDEESVKRGLYAVEQYGRIEVIRRGGNVYVLDGGHNPSALEPLAEFVKSEFNQADALVFGCLSDKDICGCIEKLRGRAKRVYAVKPNSPRAMDMAKITRALREVFGAAEEVSRVADALEKTRGVTVVCGSFTLLKEAKQWIEKE